MGEGTAPRRVTRWLTRRLPRLLARPGVVAAWVFGSHVRREADRYSDVDLIVVAETRRPFVERFRDFRDVLRDAPIGVDLLIYTPDEFAEARRSNRFVRHALRGARRLI
jgi:predicted nucleotidyltransferase